MTSLYQAIYNILRTDEKTNAELIKIFEKSKASTIREYASRVRKSLKGDVQYVDSKEEESKQCSITMEILEPLIYDKIMKNPTNQDLKLAVEIIKIKTLEKGMSDDIDIDKFIDKSRKLLGITGKELPHKDLDKDLKDKSMIPGTMYKIEDNFINGYGGLKDNMKPSIKSILNDHEEYK